MKAMGKGPVAWHQHCVMGVCDALVSCRPCLPAVLKLGQLCHSETCIIHAHVVNNSRSWSSHGLVTLLDNRGMCLLEWLVTILAACRCVSNKVIASTDFSQRLVVKMLNTMARQRAITQSAVGSPSTALRPD